MELMQQTVKIIRLKYLDSELGWPRLFITGLQQ